MIQFSSEISIVADDHVVSHGLRVYDTLFDVGWVIGMVMKNVNLIVSWMLFINNLRRLSFFGDPVNRKKVSLINLFEK